MLILASVLQLLVQTHTSALCDASSQGAYSACIRSIGARIGGAGPSVVPTMARAAVAAGVDGVFIETHPDPANALSDGANMLPLDQLEDLLTTLASLHEWRQTHA